MRKNRFKMEFMWLVTGRSRGDGVAGGGLWGDLISRHYDTFFEECFVLKFVYLTEHLPAILA